MHKLAAKHDLKGLIKALSYQKDMRVGERAATALQRIGDPAAVEPLIGVARSDDWYVARRRAVKVLGVIGDVRAVEALIGALHDKDSDVREDAVKALHAVGDAHAAEPLDAALVGAIGEALIGGELTGARRGGESPPSDR